MLLNIDNKYKNYTNDSLLKIKLALIMDKSLEQIKKCNKDITADLNDLKTKLYSTSNLKNKNLMLFNIEDELKKEEFKEYIIDKINKEGKLNSLLDEKKKNEKIIVNNKLKIKKEENYLLNSFYCVLCHSKARNAISKNCPHLVACDDCIQKLKVCPRCGINIDGYEKIYRS